MKTNGRIALALALALAVGACGGSDPEPEPQGPAAERYALRGEVVSVNRDTGTVTIDHEEIPAFMTAMTMPFNVRDEWVFEAAEPGSRIQATLVVQDLSSWLESVVIISPASSGTAAEVMIPQAHPGAEVPAIGLTDQDGETLTLEDLRGSWYAFTFIYTRCPLPDFCPRMSEQFQAVARAIEAEPGRYGDARLFSISIDPEYDTPEVLRAYGLRYVDGTQDDPFDRWGFVRAEPADLGELAGFAGMRYMPEANEVVHNLRTILVDPEGRVVEVLVGNTWTPEELLRSLASAVAGH